MIYKTVHSKLNIGHVDLRCFGNVSWSFSTGVTRHVTRFTSQVISHESGKDRVVNIGTYYFSSQFIRSTHWSCYCHVHDYSVLQSCDIVFMVILSRLKRQRASFLFLLFVNICIVIRVQTIKKGRFWVPLTGLTKSQFWSYHRISLGICFWSFFVFNDLMWEEGDRFVEIDGIVDHLFCVHLLFTTSWIDLCEFNWNTWWRIKIKWAWYISRDRTKTNRSRRQKIISLRYLMLPLQRTIIIEHQNAVMWSCTNKQRSIECATPNTE